MKNKINLSGASIGAAAIIAGFADNAQAIPISHHDHNGSQTMRALDQSMRNQTLAILLTTSPSSKSSKVRQTSSRPRPGSRNVNPPTLGGLSLTSSQGAYPLRGLHAPLLPAAPVNLPPPPVATVNSNTVSVPDGGATAALMAGSLGGLALLRKKLKA